MTAARKLDYDAIPPDLRATDNWVVWKWTVREGKRTKPPVDPKTGTPGDATDPALWMSFDRAVAEAAHFDGMGFAVTSGMGLTGVDLDKCRDPQTGAIAPEARAIVDRLGSYTEITPSGTGLRVWVRGTLPSGRRRKGHVEMYDGGRYFTVTGDHLEGTPTAIAERSAELAALHAEIFPPEVAAPRTVPVVTNLGDREVLDRMFAARNGREIEALFRGDTSAFASGSEADLALCSHLAFWTGDEAAVDRLFRLSALCDGKWTDRPDYRARTLAKAMNRTEFYGENSQRQANGGNGVRALSVSSVAPASPKSGVTPFPPLSCELEDERPAVVRPWPKPPGNAAWHGPAGELAKNVEEFTEGDPLGILVQTILGFGAMLGRRVYSQVSSTRHYTNLFVCTAGKTSAGRKGTAWDVVLEMLAACDHNFATTRIKGGLSSGEGLIYTVRDQVTKKVPMKQKGRIVGYQDEIADEGVADKRVIITETEFGRTLGVMGREGNTLSSVIRQAWDGSTLDSLTKGNTNRATNAHVSLVAHVTAQEVTKLLTSTDAANGFANRFLWVAVRKTKSLPRGSAIPDAAKAGPLEKLRRALEMVGDHSFEIRRSPEAEAYWTEIYDSLAPDHPGLIGSILGRGQPQTLRLSMLYALMDGKFQVGYEHLDAALTLWRYCEASARYIFGDAMGDREADRLLSDLRLAPEGLSRTTIQNVVFQKNKTTEELDRILGRLVEAKLIEPHKIDTDGRPRTVWRAVSIPG